MHRSIIGRYIRFRPIRRAPGSRRAAPDPRRQVARYAATQPGIHRRAGPLLQVLAQAAPTDPALRVVWTSIEESRRHGHGGFVAMLAERGVLRPGLTLDTARDGLWALTSLAVFDMLVTAAGWSVEDYEHWLADQLTHPVLLPD